MSDLLQDVVKEQLRDSTPDFSPGDTIRVSYRIREGEKERIQAFEGVCIKRRGGGVAETFTVRKISSGIGVERVAPRRKLEDAFLALVGGDTTASGER